MLWFTLRRGFLPRLLNRQPGFVPCTAPVPIDQIAERLGTAPGDEYEHKGSEEVVRVNSGNSQILFPSTLIVCQSIRHCPRGRRTQTRCFIGVPRAWWYRIAVRS